jgi:hypothetical protein
LSDTRRELAAVIEALADVMLWRELQWEVWDECLNAEIFCSLTEAQIVIEKGRVEYNTRRPHSALVAPNSISQALAVK